MVAGLPSGEAPIGACHREASYSGGATMSKLFKRLLTLQILQKYQRVPLKYKLIVACLFPLIVLSFCTMGPAWIYPYNTENGESVTIVWDPNNEPDLAGYKLYSGTTSGLYENKIDVGLDTYHTITDLEPGKTYYITATAYNVYGVESAFTEKIIHTVTF